MIIVVVTSGIDDQGEGKSFERGGDVPRDRVVSSEIDKGRGSQLNRRTGRIMRSTQPRCYLSPISLLDRSFNSEGRSQPDGRPPRKLVMAWFGFFSALI